MTKITATRYHDFSCGHRVVGHEGKCALLHGHNYRAYFTVETESGSLDSIARVLDFSAIKETVCDWLENSWDHRFLAWEKDSVIRSLLDNDPDITRTLRRSIVFVPFNPTAESMAQYLLEVVGPLLLADRGCRLTKVTVEETRKCSATAERES